MTVRKLGLLAATGAAALGYASAANAGAFYLQEQSVKAVGRAFSGEAADTGPESLWWNPAAIAGQPGGVYLGASAIQPKGKVIDTGTLIRRPGQPFASVGGDANVSDPINKGVVPSGAVAFPLNERVSLGLAVTSPFSFTTNYDADSWTRYSADKSKLRTIDVQPGVAVLVTDWLRVGGAANIEYTKATLSNKLPNLSPLLADGQQTLQGDGWDLGWSAGLQMFNDWATVGISYKSSIKHKLKGEVTVAGLLGPLAAQNRSVDATATFRTPWQATIAGRFRMTPQVTLNMQASRIGWDKFDAITLGAPLNTAIPENYKESWNAAAGFDYDVTPDFTVRAGAQYDTTPTRDGYRDARVPDADRWSYSVGASYRLSPRFTVDAAAMYTDFKNETIDRPTAAYAGTAAQTVIVTQGRVEDARALVFALGGRYSF